ncbi:MAG: nuclease-related domain-containing protein, partial [Rhodoglobus sp.]
SERAPARAAMEKLISYRGTDELKELPFGLVRIYPEALNWLRGARGELFMAARLAKLGPAWTVLHSVPVGDRGSDIDHLVIGPAGVFPINTKRLIDRDIRVDGERFRSDGWKTQYLRNSAFEARRVVDVMNRAGLSAPVLPIIALSGARSVRVKSPPHWEGVTVGVATTKEVVKRLKKRSHVLSPEQVAGIASALKDSTAWARSAPRSDHDPELVQAFQRIDRGVGRLTLLILFAGGALMIGTAWWVGLSISNLFSLLS